jgi:pyrroloquinoline-quinone synthase
MTSRAPLPYLTESFLCRLDAAIATKHVLTHPFYQAWNQGTLSLEALQDYACQYYNHVAAFPTYLSALHARIADPELRKPILQNLIEEEGGSPNHPELWLRFAQGLGLTRSQVLNAAVQPETANCVATFRALCSQGHFTRGLAALYAYESQIPEVSETKIEGLKQHYGVRDAETWRYFAVHVEADKAHREQEKQLLAQTVCDAGVAEEALAAAQQALEALWNLLSGVCRRHHIPCAAGNEAALL